jgi:hypothetical protein
MQDLIENILPRNRISLVAGISNAGKSRGFISMLCQWSLEMPVLGFKSHPVPWCIVCGDRPVEDLHDTLRSMGYPIDVVPIISAFGRNHKRKSVVIEEAQKLGAKLIFWEGFDMVPDSTVETKCVFEFLSELTAYCEDGLTILGSVGISKLKPYEVYSNPRQLVGGSSMWERSTSTNFVLMPRYPGNVEAPERVLFVSVKNFPSFTVGGKFSEQGDLEFMDWKCRLQGQWLKEAVDDMRGKKRDR